MFYFNTALVNAAININYEAINIALEIFFIVSLC